MLRADYRGNKINIRSRYDQDNDDDDDDNNNAIKLFIYLSTCLQNKLKANYMISTSKD
jgi:hypothetical protein